MANSIAKCNSFEGTPPHHLKRQIMNPKMLEQLVTQTMPFGKYKGRMLADLPGHYLAWFAREGFPKGELGTLLALMLEINHNGLKALLDPLRGQKNGAPTKRPQKP